MSETFSTPEQVVQAIVAKVGKRLVVGTPLAAGKPPHLLNALYRAAEADPEIQLTILTALSISRPTPSSDLEARFMGPFLDRVFGNTPGLLYEEARMREALPENVRVLEFYFVPAKYRGHPKAQQDYISSNYTHAARDLLDRGLNVLVQQVSPGQDEDEGTVSLSSNPDLTPDLVRAMRTREANGEPVAVAAQVNRELPFMYGDAQVPTEIFDFVLEHESLHCQVLGTPRLPVSDVEHAIGLNISTLIKDGGELQIGIGAIGDAIVNALLLRHTKNDAYRKVVADFELESRFGMPLCRLGELSEFSEGLFAASEMIAEGFLHLMEAGIIKRKVYDDLVLQRLLNANIIGEKVDLNTLDQLFVAGRIHSPLTEEDFVFLRHFGVFAEDAAYRPRLRLADEESRAWIARHALGERLQHGAIMHGAFLLGSQDMYRALRRLPRPIRKQISMRRVSRINQLYGHEALDRLHRRNARFVNTCMMITLSGAAVSDGLEDGTVISGVGGQFNFVVMAQELPDGHSILNARATRTTAEGVSSNIVFRHGHNTIPRHLRDVYVTEYGIAFVRGKTDAEIIQELLKITDSRFQDALLAEAKAAGKLARGYRIPDRFRNNRPEWIEARLKPHKAGGLFPAFPLGTDFTDEELVLGKALKRLKAASTDHGSMTRLLVQAAGVKTGRPDLQPLLKRMGLDHPRMLKERIYRRLLTAALLQIERP